MRIMLFASKGGCAFHPPVFLRPSLQVCCNKKDHVISKGGLCRSFCLPRANPPPLLRPSMLAIVIVLNHLKAFHDPNPTSFFFFVRSSKLAVKNVISKGELCRSCCLQIATPPPFFDAIHASFEVHHLYVIVHQFSSCFMIGSSFF